MDIQEIKKDVKNMHMSKNVIICGLSVALVLVSAVAIGLAVGGEGHGERGERGNGRMEQNSKEQGMYDDHNVNPNDGETNDDQATSMNGMMTNMTSGMQGKTGKELEKAFLTEMIVHHQGAVDMAKMLLQDKTISPELVKFANGIISAQESEIKQMNDWVKNY